MGPGRDLAALYVVGADVICDTFRVSAGDPVTIMISDSV